MKVNAFKRGFASGFSATFTFFSPDEIIRPPKSNGSVEKAWADVGRLLDEAIREQGERIEQAITTKQ